MYRCRLLLVCCLPIIISSCADNSLNLVCEGTYKFTNLTTGQELIENRTETYTFKDKKLGGYLPVTWSNESIYYSEESEREKCL